MENILLLVGVASTSLSWLKRSAPEFFGVRGAGERIGGYLKILNEMQINNTIKIVQLPVSTLMRVALAQRRTEGSVLLA